MALCLKRIGSIDIDWQLVQVNDTAVHSTSHALEKNFYNIKLTESRKQKLQRQIFLAVWGAWKVIFWPNQGIKVSLWKFWVLCRGDLNFYLRTPLWEVDRTLICHKAPKVIRHSRGDALCYTLLGFDCWWTNKPVVTWLGYSLHEQSKLKGRDFNQVNARIMIVHERACDFNNVNS